MLTLWPLVSAAGAPASWLAAVGSAGSPRFEVCWIVAVNAPRGLACATSASSCAALRFGSEGPDCALATADAAITMPTVPTTPAGTAHRAQTPSFRTLITRLQEAPRLATQ